MTIGVAPLPTLGNATTQPTIARATTSATPTADARSRSPMTARELRAQLRAQQGRNNAAQPRNTEPDKVALADPDPTLMSLRALVDDSVTDDDRRCCNDCVNLTAREHRCLAAWRGERPGNAARNYHPVIDVPRRCERYKPQPSEQDQRTGAERWPYLVAGLGSPRVNENAARGNDMPARLRQCWQWIKPSVRSGED